VACAESIAASTTDAEVVEAHEAMSLRLRATRRLMRRVNRWVPRREEMTADESAEAVSQICEQAAIIYDRDYVAASSDRRDAFHRQALTASPVQAVEGLRALIENPRDDA
jgi:hypothetical protein